FFQADDGIRDRNVTGVQTCALPILAFVAGSVGLDYADDEAFLGSVRAKGEQMRDTLEAIAAKHPDRAWQVRGRGMIQALDTGDRPEERRVGEEPSARLPASPRRRRE